MIYLAAECNVDDFEIWLITARLTFTGPIEQVPIKKSKITLACSKNGTIRNDSKLTNSSSESKDKKGVPDGASSFCVATRATKVMEV